jgi:hypothetical protein
MPRRATEEGQPLELTKILKLINDQAKPTRDLFAKALTIYFSGNRTEAEKRDLLRKALEQETAE